MAKVMLFEKELERKLDKDRNLLACLNGVIELRTGVLREGRPEDCLSKTVRVEYGGIELATPSVDAFFADILNGDVDYISYQQTMLGYGITGHVTDQVNCACQGSIVVSASSCIHMWAAIQM